MTASDNNLTDNNNTNHSVSITPPDVNKPAPCSRNYNDGGAHSVQMTDGIACCVSCGQPIEGHINGSKASQQGGLREVLKTLQAKTIAAEPKTMYMDLIDEAVAAIEALVPKEREYWDNDLPAVMEQIKSENRIIATIKRNFNGES